MEKYIICYLRSDLKNTIEEPRPMLDVIKEYILGAYSHSDYYCSKYNSEEEALEAYQNFCISDGEAVELIESNAYSFISTLSEEGL